MRRCHGKLFWTCTMLCKCEDYFCKKCVPQFGDQENVFILLSLSLVCLPSGTPHQEVLCVFHPKRTARRCECLHLPAADTTHLTTTSPGADQWVLRPDYSKVSCCQNIMSISVSLRGKCMKGIITSPFKASVRFPLQREIVQLASKGSAVFFIEVVCICKACR